MTAIFIVLGIVFLLSLCRGPNEFETGDFGDKE